MDPEACILEIVSSWNSLRSEDNELVREEMVWHLQGLAEWIDKGGFIPKDICLKYVEEE